ncbi:MAG: VCBS repeat-containing protein [Burkholderiales bacterium]|nr:VCBS repeat-containing protein [Burkholderiales bacterium]
MRTLFKAVAVAVVGVPLALAVAGSTFAPNAAQALADAALAAPAYTAEQRVALQRAHQAQQHPQWRTLTAEGRVGRLAMLAQRKVQALASGTSPTPGLAPFQGNLTQVRVASGQAFVLQRQADCSLSELTGSYTLSFTAPAINVQATTANFQDVLHGAAGLGTQAGTFPRGCADPATAGLGSRRGFFLGRTSQNLWFFASTGYYYPGDTDALYYNTVDAATRTVHSYNTDTTVRDIAGMTAGDLNGDGLADIVVLDMMSSNVTVFLAHADGSIGAPVTYAATGSRSRAAVLTDLDGDGKLDLVVAGSTLNTTTNRDEQSIAILRGRGDGTFGAAATFPVATPTTSYNGLLVTMVAADLRGTGKADIVGSNGLVLLNNGSGGLAPAPAFAFPAPTSSNSYGPNLATGDFNEDGKVDVVVGTGDSMQIHLGRGDGSFTPGRAYANNDSVGYVTATDLDGDGHLDLWVGLGNGGFLGGDQYGVNQGYALMGRGDGSFAGAPLQPFVYTGHNLVDLDKDGKLDGVAPNADRSFTTWKGDGSGGFTAVSTLLLNSLVYGGLTQGIGEIDSFDLADVDGDGNIDLVILGRDFVARNSTADFYSPGLLIARGNGSGGFATPTFLPAPAFTASPDFDYNPKLSNVRLADVNGDGKADLVYAYASTAYATNQRTVGTAVQLGNGDGSFRAPQTFTFYSGTDNGSFQNLSSVVQQFVDLNKDGKLDLVMITQTSTIDRTLSAPVSNVQVALGRGDGTFAAPATVAGPEIMTRYYADTQPVPLVVADMNGDGTLDMAILGSSSGYNLQVALALGNGDGSFKPPARTTFAAQALGNGQQLAVADFNADGKTDVLIANPFGTSGIVFGNGDGTLAPLGSAGSYLPNLALVLPIGGATRVVEFNGDARPDVIVGNVQLLSAGTAVAPPPGFSVGADSTTGTVKAGQSVQATLSLTPGSGFSGTVGFSCSGLPAGAACSFSPASLPLSGTTPVSTTLTISTTAAAAMGWVGRADPGAPGAIDPALPAALVLASLALLALRRRGMFATPLHRFGLAALLATGGLALHGCGGGGDGAAPGGPGGTGTPAGTYNVTVTATDGSASRTIAYTLVVD